MMLLARVYGIGTTVNVLLMVPVILFGYIELMGFGDDSLLELRRLLRMVGDGEAIARHRRNCGANAKGIEAFIV